MSLNLVFTFHIPSPKFIPGKGKVLRMNLVTHSTRAYPGCLITKRLGVLLLLLDGVLAHCRLLPPPPPGPPHHPRFIPDRVINLRLVPSLPSYGLNILLCYTRSGQYHTLASSFCVLWYVIFLCYTNITYSQHQMTRKFCN